MVLLYSPRHNKNNMLNRPLAITLVQSLCFDDSNWKKMISCQTTPQIPIAQKPMPYCILVPIGIGNFLRIQAPFFDLEFEVADDGGFDGHQTKFRHFRAIEDLAG